MVFVNNILLIRQRSPLSIFKKRRILKLSGHFYGRIRNCYSLAIRKVHRALQYLTVGRILKKIEFKELANYRLDGACSELGITRKVLLEGLARCNILLDRKSLMNLAIWEPRTFKALTQLAAAKYIEDDPPRSYHEKPLNLIPPNNVIKSKDA